MNDTREPPDDDVDPHVDLAIERAVLAWLRTAVALIGVGFAIARSGLLIRALTASGVGLTEGGGIVSLVLGVSLVLIGVFACGAAIDRAQHRSTFKSFDMALGVLLGLFGLFLSVHLVMSR